MTTIGAATTQRSLWESAWPKAERAKASEQMLHVWRGHAKATKHCCAAVRDCCQGHDNGMTAMASRWWPPHGPVRRGEAVHMERNWRRSSGGGGDAALGAHGLEVVGLHVLELCHKDVQLVEPVWAVLREERCDAGSVGLLMRPGWYLHRVLEEVSHGSQRGRNLQTCIDVHLGRPLLAGLCLQCWTCIQM